MSDSGPAHRAFTLLEVLIVIVILGITALLVVPSAGSERDIRLRTAARLLIADIELAQAESIGNGADPFIMVFDIADSSYYLAHRSDPLTPAMHPASGTPLITRYGEGRAAGLTGVAFDAIDLDGDEILGFSALGSLDQAADAVITLRAGDLTIAIAINAATGEPSVE